MTRSSPSENPNSRGLIKDYQDYESNSFSCKNPNLFIVVSSVLPQTVLTLLLFSSVLTVIVGGLWLFVVLVLDWLTSLLIEPLFKLRLRKTNPPSGRLAAPRKPSLCGGVSLSVRLSMSVSACIFSFLPSHLSFYFLLFFVCHNFPLSFHPFISCALLFIHSHLTKDKNHPGDSSPSAHHSVVSC